MWLRDIVVNSGGQGRDVEYSPNSGRPGGQQLLTGRPMDDARNIIITYGVIIHFKLHTDTCTGSCNLILKLQIAFVSVD